MDDTEKWLYELNRVQSIAFLVSLLRKLGINAIPSDKIRFAEYEMRNRPI